MKLGFDIRWLVSDSEQELDKRLLQLLTHMNPNGSLQAAATDIGISYRTAWEIIRYWNEAFHTPLCVLERGKGTSLTPLGQKLIQTKHAIETGYAEALKLTADDLNNEIDGLIGKSINKNKLNTYASNDLAIHIFQELCEAKQNLDIDFIARGSLDALKQLHTNQYNIAGFHFPDGELAKLLAPEYRQLLDDKKHLFINLATRQQGLMFKPSQQGRIKSIDGLTRRSIKFINRQRGSGTRAIFDQLLKLNNINRKEINGYKKEEFTHTAVAAMISSGHADVAFGLKAAASQFKLSFLPLVTETYVIAMNKSLPEEVKKNIRLLIKAEKLKTKINKLPGYDASLTGKIIHAEKLLSPVL
ncbi:MAG: helix-turn-helix transcriptional regulator [Proteobacteria bacterium]|nr:LysR family transcriptional regulator [Pseudomonadota bacterium]NOG60567.1 helix-turn-helix transcriptional regulator [Pseudomonadota bacterium]